jgi:hypothetical protein
MKHLPLVLVCMLGIGSAHANMQVQDGKITAEFTSQPLSQTANKIREQTGINIIIDENVANETISANFKDLPLAMGIKKMLEGTGINYAVIAGSDGSPSAIYISGSEKPGTPPKKLDTRPVAGGNYPNRGVVTPVNPTPPPQSQQLLNRNEEKLTAREIQEKDPKNMPVNPGGTTGNVQPAPPSIPKFDPNNVPTAGGFAPTLNPPPQTLDGQNPNSDDDEDDDEDDEE